MMIFYSLMGIRRREAIKKALDKWKKLPRNCHASRGEKTMSICHPDRPVAANLLCEKCYMREWRKKTGRNGTYYRKLREQKIRGERGTS